MSEQGWERLSGVDHVRVFVDHAGEWRFTAVAGNGEPVATSEGYTRKESAEERVKALWPEVRIVEEQA